MKKKKQNKTTTYKLQEHTYVCLTKTCDHSRLYKTCASESSMLLYLPRGVSHESERAKLRECEVKHNERILFVDTFV